MAFYDDKKKEGKLILPSLPSLLRKYSLDLDYETVTVALD